MSALPVQSAPRLNDAPIATDAVSALSPSQIDLAGMTLDEVERMAIEQAISRSKGNIVKAARALAVSPSTIYRKLERWGG